MAFELQPPKSTALIDIQQAWYRLRDLLNKQYVDTGWGNILFVDAVDGNDTTAKRGSITFSYATIQAALDAAQEGDVVWVGPGTYTEALVWPDTENLTIQGVGLTSVITTADASPTVAIAPTDNVVTSAIIKNVFITNTGAQPAIQVDGTNCNDLGNPGVLQFQDLFLTSTGATTVDLTICGNVEFDNVSGSAENVSLTQVGQVILNACQFNGLDIDNDPAQTEPGTGFGAVAATACVFGGNVTVSDLGVFAGTDDVQVQGDFTVSVVDTATANGSVNFSGRILGDVLVNFDFDDPAGLTAAVFDYARITGTFSCGLVPLGVGGNVAAIRALHATFFSTGAGELAAGNEAALDIRGATYAQAALASSGATPGTIDRTHWYETIASGSDLATGVAITFGIPYPAAAAGNYTVVTEAADQLDDAGGMGISSKLATGVTVTGTNGGGVSSAGDVRVHVIREFD